MLWYFRNRKQISVEREKITKILLTVQRMQFTGEFKLKQEQESLIIGHYWTIGKHPTNSVL